MASSTTAPGPLGPVLVNAGISAAIGAGWYALTGGTPLDTAGGTLGAIVPPTILPAFFMTIGLTLAADNGCERPAFPLLARRAAGFALLSLILLPIGFLLVELCVAHGRTLPRFVLSQALYGALLGGALAPLIRRRASFDPPLQFRVEG